MDELEKIINDFFTVDGKEHYTSEFKSKLSKLLESARDNLIKESEITLGVALMRVREELNSFVKTERMRPTYELRLENEFKKAWQEYLAGQSEEKGGNNGN